MTGEQHVLIVEDDANDAYFIQRAFMESGVARRPHICMSMDEAVQYLEGSGQYSDRERFPIPTLLITDLKMPGQSGFDLLRWIRDHPEFQVVPTVVMSSSRQPDDVKCAYCLGANAYLCKPSGLAELKTAFTHLLNFWGLCEVPEPGAPTCEQLMQNPG